MSIYLSELEMWKLFHFVERQVSCLNLSSIDDTIIQSSSDIFDISFAEEFPNSSDHETNI